jgi:protein-tyrosine phosphatase
MAGCLARLHCPLSAPIYFMKPDHCSFSALYCVKSVGRFLYWSCFITVIVSCSVKLPPKFSEKTLPEVNYVVNNSCDYTLHMQNRQAVSSVLLRSAEGKTHVLPLRGDSVLRLKNQMARPAFMILTGDDTLTVLNRRLDFGKMVNFRDLGGLKTTEGRTVKWGKIFRSDNLSTLKTREFERFNDLNIKTVYDLRTDHEIKGKEDHLPTGVQYVHSPTVKDNEGQIAQLRARVIKGEISEEQATYQTIGFYHDAAAVNMGSLTGIIQQIINSDEPVLYHCSAGKDRTGIVSALILSILRVDRAMIMKEYLMSNYYRRAKTEKMMGKARLARIIKPKLDLKAIRVFMTVDERFLNAFFEVIDNEYGGMDKFIRNQLGIDDDARKQIIEKLTY